MRRTPGRGLTEEEAQARLARYGENKLQEQKKKSLFARFIEQFKDVMIIILLIAGVRFLRRHLL